MFDLEHVAEVVEFACPSCIGPVPAEKRFRVRSAPARDGFDVGDSLAPACDGESLTVVLDGVEEVGELACGFRRGHLGHEIRLSDSLWGATPSLFLFGRAPENG